MNTKSLVKNNPLKESPNYHKSFKLSILNQSTDYLQG